MLAAVASAAGACAPSERVDVEDDEAYCEAFHLRDGTITDAEDTGSTTSLSLIIRVPDSGAEQVYRGLVSAGRLSSRGVPLWESKPGARVALYIDVMGGYYDNDEYYGPADLDGDENDFNEEEGIALIRAAMELELGYRGFDVNVTTDKSKMQRSRNWGWILLTNDAGSGGKFKIGGISSNRNYPTGYAGADFVFEPDYASQAGYLLIHEFGHGFGLQHTGKYRNGTWYKLDDLPSGSVDSLGDWMGGRGDGQFTSGFAWRTDLYTEYSSSTPQNNRAKISAVSGTLNCGSECTAECPCTYGEERDCDNDGQCKYGSKCRPKGSIEICQVGSGTPPACGPECTPECPCSASDTRDCDNNSQCVAGLVCVERGSIDRCEASTCGPECSAECPCTLFENRDCDSNRQCAAGLTCVERGYTDICMSGNPTCGSQCSSQCPCTFDENRDCDSNSECVVGLTCVESGSSDFCR